MCSELGRVVAWGEVILSCICHVGIKKHLKISRRCKLFILRVDDVYFVQL